MLGWNFAFQVVEALGALATVGAFFMLFVKDRGQQRQIDELTTLARETTGLRLLEHEKLKLSAKPKLWLNGASMQNKNNELQIDLNNKGERAILTRFEVLRGSVHVTNLNLPYDLEKGSNCLIFMRTPKNVDVRNVGYQIRIFYEDEVGTRYESVIEGIGTKVELVRTEEVQSQSTVTRPTSLKSLAA